ncbi:hypothetical protein CEP51_014331 [Fusarium floridanum]|uniref:NmrA-like domain-containing protein n=1 Tax=Fusarium floridanum TaxID=1325733 RepID=A0A428PV38_9HYPO|nr:hypothetical protein CEP51_014331 [Fusarium floridanum]
MGPITTEQNIRNVAVAGATGLLGSLVLKALIESGQFNVTMLGRAGRSDSPPPGAQLAIVDYSNTESLVKALHGQDAVVSTLSREATLLQIPLIDAAVAAGVKRFLPSEFGANLQNPNVRKLENYKNKVQVEDYLEERSRASGITYTYIYNNVLVDWATEKGVVLNLKHGHACLYNGGEQAVSMITVSTAAQAVAAVLTRSQDTKNRAVRIHEGLISQRQLLDYAKELELHTEWREDHVDLDELESRLREGQEPGVPNLSLFHAYAVKGAFSEGFGNQFGEEDNRLLGIQPWTADDVKKMLARIASSTA